MFCLFDLTYVYPEVHNSTALDPCQKEEEMKTKDNMEEDSRTRDENHDALLGVIDVVGSRQAEVEELCSCPTHHWV